ncbi:MAG TPA: PAS domain S-box protein, partial [Nitrospirota bacterium]
MENGFTQLSPTQSNGHFELLAMTAGELLQSTEPQKVVESICRKVMEQVECHAFFNYLVDEQRGKLHLNACAGIPDEEARRIEWLDYGVAVCGCVARDGSRIVAEHIPTTPDVRTDLVRSYGIKAYACHPLLGPGGKIIGTLSFGTCSRETFSEDELSLMKTVTDLVATAMNRMENEEAIRQNQMDLARAQEVGNIGSWRINVRKNELSWSDENYRIFGIPKGPALTYERFLSLVHPDDRSYVDARWSASLRGEPYDIEHRIVANGRVKWVRERAYLEFDDGGTLIGGFGIAQDITDRKRAEEALLMAQADLELRVEERTRELTVASESVRTERQRLFDVLETLPVYVILLTPEHRIPFANRFFRERFGESGGRRCYEYLFKRAEPCETCETFTVLRTNAPHHWYWTGPDGRDYDIYDYPFVDSDGSTLILEMGIDITDQNRAQKALGLMNEKLVRMVKETEDLYNNAPCGYHSVDENGIIMRINDTELRWLGYSREEIVGKKRFRDLLTPESRHVVEMTFPVFKKQGSVADLVLDARRRDGSILPVLMSATAIYDGAGKYVMSRSMLYDLTERKKTEQQNSVTNALLSLYARTVGRREYLDAAVDLLRKWSGCRRVGIRIADGQGSIPYASCIGFSSEFLESENALSLERDHCACTRVVLGIPEPQDLPAMTRAGSFYSNNTLRFVEGLSEEEKNRFRGVCVRTGFLSVAVVPMRYRDRVLGSLHVADEREGMFSPDSVE